MTPCKTLAAATLSVLCGLRTVLPLGSVWLVTPASAALSQQENQAVVALLKSAIEEFSAGRPEQTAAALERALRIEPNNAILWHYLGQTRLHQGHYQEAESLAAKSNNLIGDNDALRARNIWLIAAARHAAAQNRTASGAGSEQPPLQQRLDEETARRRQAEAENAALRERLAQAQAQCRQAGASSQAPGDAPVAPEKRPDAPYERDLATGQTQEKTPGVAHDQNPMQIPPSHWPPPGQCRLWFPDRLPGHQPPPGDCRALKRQLPANAWLVGS